MGLSHSIPMIFSHELRPALLWKAVLRSLQERSFWKTVMAHVMDPRDNERKIGTPAMKICWEITGER